MIASIHIIAVICVLQGIISGGCSGKRIESRWKGNRDTVERFFYAVKPKLLEIEAFLNSKYALVLLVPYHPDTMYLRTFDGRKFHFSDDSTPGGGYVFSETTQSILELHGYTLADLYTLDSLLKEGGCRSASHSLSQEVDSLRGTSIECQYYGSEWISFSRVHIGREGIPFPVGGDVIIDEWGIEVNSRPRF